MGRAQGLREPIPAIAFADDLVDLHRVTYRLMSSLRIRPAMSPQRLDAPTSASDHAHSQEGSMCRTSERATRRPTRRR